MIVINEKGDFMKKGFCLVWCSLTCLCLSLSSFIYAMEQKGPELQSWSPENYEILPNEDIVQAINRKGDSEEIQKYIKFSPRPGGYFFCYAQADRYSLYLPQRPLTMVRLLLMKGPYYCSSWGGSVATRNANLAVFLAFSQDGAGEQRSDCVLSPDVLCSMFRNPRANTLSMSVCEEWSIDWFRKNTHGIVRQNFEYFETNMLGRPYLDLSASERITLKEEALCALGSVYKIHLQVNPRYLVSFLRDFSVQFVVNGAFLSVREFKVVANPCDEVIVRDRFPMVVLYVYPFNGNMLDRRRILDPVIWALRERYGEYVNVISRKDYEPRFSRKIDNLVYITNGDGDIKRLYRDLLARGYLKENLLYTPDFAFVRGFEYRAPWE